ncbi:hypothetical protein VIGAN_06023000, partial [Vigna angularis var. angularis]
NFQKQNWMPKSFIFRIENGSKAQITFYIVLFLCLKMDKLKPYVSFLSRTREVLHDNFLLSPIVIPSSSILFPF